MIEPVEIPLILVIVLSPSALVVPSAPSHWAARVVRDRPRLGYGVGMSATLVAADLLIIQALEDRRSHPIRQRLGRLVLALPVITVTFVIVSRTGLAARAADQL